MRPDHGLKKWVSQGGAGGASRCREAPPRGRAELAQQRAFKRRGKPVKRLRLLGCAIHDARVGLTVMSQKRVTYHRLSVFTTEPQCDGMSCGTRKGAAGETEKKCRELGGSASVELWYAFGVPFVCSGNPGWRHAAEPRDLPWAVVFNAFGIAGASRRTLRHFVKARNWGRSDRTPLSLAGKQPVAPPNRNVDASTGYSNAGPAIRSPRCCRF